MKGEYSTMYDCILINPRSIYFSVGERKNPYLYTGTLSIATVLQTNGYRARVIDMVALDDPIAALEQYVGKYSQELLLIGFSVMTSQIPHALMLTKYLKQKYPRIPIIWGGIHAALYPESILKNGLVDFVCTGEGEFSTLELLARLKSEKKEFGDVNGICFIKDGNIVHTPPQECHSLDDIPFFDYELIDYPEYKTKSFTKVSGQSISVTYGTVLTGIGCPYKCTFCINSNKKLYLGKFRHKSAKRVVDEIEFLINKHGITYFDLIDENFFANKKRVFEFIDLVKSRKLSFHWFTNIRADYFRPNYITREVMQALKEIGCFRLGIGAESGSPKILKKIKKEITPDDLIHSAMILRDTGIDTSYSFMMGIPGEMKEDIVATIGLIQKLAGLSRDNFYFIGPQIYRPYPGGELFEECVTHYNYQPPATLEEWQTVLNFFTGYETIDNMPWVTDKDFINMISFYTDFMNTNVKSLKINAIKKLLLSIMKSISAFRLKHNFWSLKIEMRIILSYKKLRLHQKQ